MLCVCVCYRPGKGLMGSSLHEDARLLPLLVDEALAAFLDVDGTGRTERSNYYCTTGAGSFREERDAHQAGPGPVERTDAGHGNAAWRRPLRINYKSGATAGLEQNTPPKFLLRIRRCFAPNLLNIF